MSFLRQRNHHCLQVIRLRPSQLNDSVVLFSIPIERASLLKRNCIDSNSILSKLEFWSHRKCDSTDQDKVVPNSLSCTSHLFHLGSRPAHCFDSVQLSEKFVLQIAIHYQPGQAIHFLLNSWIPLFQLDFWAARLQTDFAFQSTLVITFLSYQDCSYFALQFYKWFNVRNLCRVPISILMTYLSLLRKFTNHPALEPFLSSGIFFLTFLKGSCDLRDSLFSKERM